MVTWKYFVKTRKLIPGRLNFFILGSIFCVVGGFLLIEPIHGNIFFTVFGAVLISFLLLTNYALLHEAAHDHFHSNHQLNYLGGVLSGFLFPISFSLVKITHAKHHACNRTLYESFDIISPDDHPIVRKIQWYSILTGMFWPGTILGNLLVVFFPGARNWKLFQNRKSTKLMLEDLQASDVLRIRIESVFLLVVWSSLILSGLVSFKIFLLCYLCFAFNWSTRQYITHAFSPRKVIEGAFNLKTSKIHQWILLNSNWDREHHEYPDFPWIVLPRLGRKRSTDRSYLQQYYRMWLGPVCSEEVPPNPLPVIRNF